MKSGAGMAYFCVFYDGRCSSLDICGARGESSSDEAEPAIAAWLQFDSCQSGDRGRDALLVVTGAVYVALMAIGDGPADLVLSILVLFADETSLIASEDLGAQIWWRLHTSADPGKGPAIPLLSRGEIANILEPNYHSPNASFPIDLRLQLRTLKNWSPRKLMLACVKI